jgi:hypothetical protein
VICVLRQASLFPDRYPSLRAVFVPIFTRRCVVSRRRIELTPEVDNGSSNSPAESPRGDHGTNRIVVGGIALKG